MPAKSQKQRRLFGMIVAYKKGKLPNASKQIKQIAKGISLQDAQHFARKVQHKGDNKLKLMDLINQDKVIQGKDYKISGFADKPSGNIVFKIISQKPQILKIFRNEEFANAVKKVYGGGVKMDYNSFKKGYTMLSMNSYDTSQSSLLKVMNLIRDKIQKFSKF